MSGKKLFLYSKFKPHVTWFCAFRGYKRFLKRSILESSNFIKDDCLALRCTVGVVRTRVEGPKQDSIPIPPSSMGQDLKSLLESEVGCDVVFEVGDEKFKAHKLVLGSRSPVFRAQFYGLIGDPNLEKVVLQDLEPSIFKVLLLQSHVFALITLLTE